MLPVLECARGAGYLGAATVVRYLFCFSAMGGYNDGCRNPPTFRCKNLEGETVCCLRHIDCTVILVFGSWIEDYGEKFGKLVSENYRRVTHVRWDDCTVRLFFVLSAMDRLMAAMEAQINEGSASPRAPIPRSTSPHGGSRRTNIIPHSGPSSRNNGSLQR